MSSHLVFDIETVIDPDLPIAEGPESQKLPAAPHHQVVAIGALLLSGSERKTRRLGIVGRESTSEAEILTEFTELVERHNPTLVSYNGRSFDLPVIASRCLRHGVPFRAYYRGRDMRYRFSDLGHFDLMDFLADFGATRPARLDVMAKLCGMPGKVGVDGKDVGPLVHQGRIDEVRDYCLCDVVQTAAVFLRVELLRGALDVEQYLQATRDLLQTVAEYPSVSEALWPHLDQERLLLGRPLEPEGATSVGEKSSAFTSNVEVDLSSAPAELSPPPHLPSQPHASPTQGLGVSRAAHADAAHAGDAPDNGLSEHSSRSPGESFTPDDKIEEHAGKSQ